MSDELTAQSQDQMARLRAQALAKSGRKRGGMGGVVRNETVATALRPGTGSRPGSSTSSTFVPSRIPPPGAAGGGAGAATSHPPGGGYGGGMMGMGGPRPAGAAGTMQPMQLRDADSDSDGDGAQAFAAKLRSMGIDETVTPMEAPAGSGGGAMGGPAEGVERPRMGPSSGPSRLDVRDKRSFLGHAPPRVGMIQCYVERDKSGFKKLHPEYCLYLDRSSGTPEQNFLLAGRKRKKNKTSNYLISMDKEDLHRNSGNFYGKVRSNFVGTEFTVYDKGEKPTKDGGLQQRQELAAVMYQTNILVSKGPRQMQVCVPRVDDATGRRAVWKQEAEDSELLVQALKNPDDPRSSEIMKLENKKPSWNDELRAYVLNFDGRVTVASVKNFQLVDVRNPEKVLVQFGKVGPDRFNLDFQYPICGLQAFAIALTAFDNKLACE
eukprot:Hpha_TRINITY_DN15848_c4_g22::TRINITY_DN15848_c4_g22_i1::g.189060::m.189060